MRRICWIMMTSLALLCSGQASALEEDGSPAWLDQVVTVTGEGLSIEEFLQQLTA